MAGNDVSISVRVRDNTSGAFQAVKAAVMDLTGAAIVPAAAAVVALGAQLAGAGAAVGVFGAAVAPQAKAIQTVAAAQDKYNEAVKVYGKNSSQALKAQEEFKAQMSSLPAATQDTAKAFISLKGAYGQWSDSLSGDTMPIFTTALQTVQGILPKLTPLVKNVAGQLKVLVDRFAAFSKTPAFDRIVAKFSEFASGSLKHVISGVETLAKTVAGWVGSKGFQDFIDLAAREGPGIAEAFKNLAEFVGKFVAAAGPLGGIQIKILEIMAKALNSIPMDVLQVLVPTILGIVAAIRLWTIAQAIWNGVMAITTALAAVNPFVLIAAAIAIVVTLIILIATKTTWFQQIWDAVWGGIKTAFKATVEFIKSHWELLLKIFLGPLLGTAVVWVVKHWTEIKETAVAVFKAVREWVLKAISAVKGFVGKTVKFFQTGIQAIIGKVKDIINWIKKFVGKTVHLAQSGASAVVGKVKDIINWIKKFVGKTVHLAQSGAGAVIGWVGDIIRKIKNFVGKTVHLGVSGVSGAISRVGDLIRKIKNLVGKTISIGVNFLKGTGSKIAHFLGFAHGGITGAQAGGPRSNTTLVGEYGPELVDLAPGSRVRSNADSRRIASGSGGGVGMFVIQLNIGPERLGEIVVDPLRKAIHTRGGNVQAVLGR